MIVSHRDLAETVKHMVKVGKGQKGYAVSEIYKRIKLTPMDGDKLQLVATDGELWIERVLEATSIKDKTPFTLDAETLNKVVKGGKTGSVVFNDATKHKERKQIGVRCNGVSLVLHPNEAGLDDQPESPEGEQVFSVDGHLHFQDNLKYVSQAMSTDETRYNLAGVCFDGANLVATDGHRLHITSYNMIVPEPVIMPARMVKTILELKPESVTISFRKDQGDRVSIHALTDQGYIIRSKALDGMFPEYRQVIPEDKAFTMRTQVKVKDFEDALKKVMNYTQDRTCAVKCKLNSKLKIKVSNMDLDLTAETVVEGNNLHQGTKYDKDTDSEIPIDHVLCGFNAKYLMEAMKHCGCDNVLVSFIDDLSPGLLSYSETGHKAIVMPMRI